MCAVSYIGDQYSKSIPNTYPWYNPANALLVSPSKAEFNALKAEVEQMKKDLEAAKKQDIADGNPDCEMEDKVKLLKDIAKLVGVDLGSVFEPNNK